MSFRVTNVTLNVCLTQVLDRENRDRYVVTVVATDNGTPVSTASTTVAITVLDSNDNTPTFTKQVSLTYLRQWLPSIQYRKQK